jgi:hypothetical protein
MKKAKAKPKAKTGKKAVTVAAPVEPSPSAPAPPAKSSAAVMAFGKDAKGNVAYCPPPEDFDTRKPMLKHLGGSRSDHWNQMLCNQVMNSGWFRENMLADERGDQQTAILAFLAGVKPTDTVEGMMAAQLYASHAASMECYRRAMLPGQTVEGKQINLTLAAKLTKANAAQVEALKKYRGKGQQKVIVEHVHVYQGGQAIVGNVTPGGSGKNTEVQPHAVGYARSPAMRCANPDREVLPIAGHG